MSTESFIKSKKTHFQLWCAICTACWVKYAVFCGRCCASNSRWLNRRVGELSPAQRGAKISDISTVSRNLPFRFARKESKVSSQGLFSITHGEVFPWGHSLSEAPRLTLGLILSSATKCYQAILETLNLRISPTIASPWPSRAHNTNQQIWSSEPHCLWSHCRRTRSRCSLSLAFPQSWRSMATSELWQCPWAWGFEGFEDVFKGSQSEAQ